MVDTAQAPSRDFLPEEKRRLRIVMETYYDVMDVRIRTEHRLRNYSEYEALVGVIGEEEARKHRMAGMKVISKEMRKYKPTEKKPVEELIKELVESGVAKEEAQKRLLCFADAFKTSWDRLSGDEAHSKVNELMRKQESICVGIAKGKVANHIVWNEWLSHVRGIGPVLSGALLSWFDPQVSPHASAWWKYAGLDVVVEKWECPACKHEIPHDPAFMKVAVIKCPKCQNPMVSIGHSNCRVKGKKVNYNPRAKTLMYRVATSFVRQPKDESGYRKLYDQFRAKYEDIPCRKIHKDDKGNVIPCFKAHKHAKAMHMVNKIFLAHLHRKWRTLLGLPVSEPWAFSFLRHDSAGIIDPIYDSKNPVEDEPVTAVEPEEEEEELDE
jgi:hypothetical protein